MKLNDLVHTVVVNYQTPDLLEQAVESFRRAYPDVRVLVVDNGSSDGSVERIQTMKRRQEGIDTLFLAENRYHGPAMHLALERLDAPYVYFFDSDTITKQGGFLELMIEQLQASDSSYGVGRVVTVNERGFPAEKGTPVLISAHMLIKRSIYHELPAFEHHGRPVLKNMAAAREEGYTLIDYPIQEYVDHLGRGTAERYGYSLGLKGKLNYLLNKMGI